MLEKIYDPKRIEAGQSQLWKQLACFHTAVPSTHTKRYAILLPPPNVTGSLHMGHAFQQTLMDLLIRYHHMCGAATLWQGGVDHAGIATQMVVERQLLQRSGQTRACMSREAFVEAVWQWKEASGQTITKQMRRLGLSIDWDRARFTMDSHFEAAVRSTFVQLYRAGLVYRAKRLINWDPSLKTALSDLEVENREQTVDMWTLAYRVASASDQSPICISVATTRPETLFGDVAIAVHPKDVRYQALVGSFVRVPLVNRVIPVIADDSVDPDLGTGAVKITPAHDFNDYEMAKRHGLPFINIFAPDATLLKTAEVFPNAESLKPAERLPMPTDFSGLERKALRDLVIEHGTVQGWVMETVTHRTVLPYGDRSGVLLEPRLTNQWFIKVDRLSAQAVRMVKQGLIQIKPSNYANQFFAWMEKIQDWCISRQLWWGHRIPAWFDETGACFVAETEVDVRRAYNLADNVQLRQEEDVLDTWFSSGLWSFVSLGWPQERAYFEAFHPTQVLITGFDILFFWVARMMMLSSFCLRDEPVERQIPFQEVYVTGLIRDEHGEKMSKSKGNVIDPIDLIDGISLEALIEKRTHSLLQPQQASKIAEKTRLAFPNGIPAYGTDALRFSLASVAMVGKDVRWDPRKLEGSRNFCNKLWNAARFILMKVEGLSPVQRSQEVKNLFDLWIEDRFYVTVEAIHQLIAQYRFDQLATRLQEFVWSEFCDWYLEFSKLASASINSIRTLERFECLLRLLHPLMPFITEALWLKVKGHLGYQEETILHRPYPTATRFSPCPAAQQAVDSLKQIFGCIRGIRADYQISLAIPLTGWLVNASNELQLLFDEQRALLSEFPGGFHGISVPPSVKGFIAKRTLVGNTLLMVPLEGIVNVTQEQNRVERALQHIRKGVIQLKQKVQNEAFIHRAPKEIILSEQERLTRLQQEEQALEVRLKELIQFKA